MKRINLKTALLALWTLLMAGTGPALAQGAVPGQPVVPLGYCQVTLSSAAVGLSSCSGGIPAGATMAYLAVETANARYRDDGMAPTTTAGFPALSTAAPFLYTGPLSKLQFIAQTGSPVLDVLFYRQ